MSRDFIEIVSVRVAAGSRTLFVDLKENADGTRFLSISEVRSAKRGQRVRILIDESYIAELHRALGQILERLAPPQTAPRSAGPSRQNHPRAYEVWTREEETQLALRYRGGRGVLELARQHGRAPTAILGRLYQLGVLKSNDKPRWD